MFHKYSNISKSTADNVIEVSGQFQTMLPKSRHNAIAMFLNSDNIQLD